MLFGNLVNKLIIFVSTFCSLFSTFALAEPVSSTDLINNAKQYDGKTVAYEGEVIGEIMARGEYAWVNVNDGQNAVGIWMPNQLTKGILYAGSYKSRGDRIEIAGVFHRACLEHGGDLDIHAQGIRQISAGKSTLEKLNVSKRNLAIVLAGILSLVWILRRLKMK